jgi:hypothetical protein
LAPPGLPPRRLSRPGRAAGRRPPPPCPWVARAGPAVPALCERDHSPAARPASGARQPPRPEIPLSALATWPMMPSRGCNKDRA